MFEILKTENTILSKHKNNCFVCGEELIYSDVSKKLTCSYCKNSFTTNVACSNEHYVCDTCHSKDALGLIKSVCEATASTNPISLAVNLMKSPALKMHGPEHHTLVPAVLIACYLNATGETESKTTLIAKAIEKSQKVPGGFCGSHGNCGAGVGIGIFVSTITHSTPLSRETWRLCNLATAKSLLVISEHGGPRCCKRDSFLAINEGILFAKEHFQIELESQDNLRCDFAHMNKQCIKEKCPFFDKS